MANRTYAQLAKIVNFWQQRLALNHWELDLKVEPDDDTRHARVVFSDDYLHATVYMYGGWESMTRTELDRVIVHELLHFYMHDMNTAARSIMYQGILPSVAEQLYADRLAHEHERAVESLSKVIVELTT